MEFFIFLVSLFVLLATGIPIAFAIMICAIIMMGYMGLDDATCARPPNASVW